MEKTNVTIIAEPVPASERIRKAAAYVRVSTDSERQQHSFATQYEYWERRIKNDSKLEFAGVYSDDGISGKSLKKRKAFLEMINHAKAGKIDIIFTKSVSRFGRNFMDVLQTVRNLRDEYGVIVYFEEEDLYSDDPLSDTLLSIRAMVAEQELKDMSENQKWSVRRRFREGRLNNNGRLYGYELQPDGNGINQLIPVPYEAEVVRLIYELHLAGMSRNGIANELIARNIPAPMGKTVWHNNTLVKILTNEKYTGDAILQKDYYEDYIRTKNIGDNPEAPMILVENSHEGIIDKTTFQTAKELISQRSNPKIVGQKHDNGDFKGIVKCGCCGTNFRHKIAQYRGKGMYGLLVCGKKLNYGKSSCASHAIKENVLQEIFISAFNEFVNTECVNDDIKELESKVKALKIQDSELYGLLQKGYINKLSYIAEHENITREITGLEKQVAARSEDNIYKAFKKKITEYDGAMVGRFLREAIVQDWTVAFVFKNGVTITKNYTNGTSGNKPGWNLTKNEEAIKNGTDNGKKNHDHTR